LKPKAAAQAPKRFVNREISWIAFNSRVLEEAEDASTPLMERIRFATIVQSNLDEFFMVRVARLQRAVEEGRSSKDLAGLTGARQLERIAEQAHALVDRLYKVLMEALLPALAGEGIRLGALDEMEADQWANLRRHFRREISPVLTPLGIDSARPFPALANLSLNVAALLGPEEDGGAQRLAVVQVPAGLQRIIRPAGAAAGSYVWLEDLVGTELAGMFPGQSILESAVFRVTRDSELEIDEDGDRDLRVEVEEQLKRRRRNRYVRLEIEKRAPERITRILAERLGVDDDHLYRVPGPLDLKPLVQLVDLPAFEHLRYAPLPPVDPTAGRDGDVFSQIDEGDILLHHPYDSFDPVVKLLAAAADDPDVLAVKQTLYRTSGDSPVIQSLRRAADRGKQVTVVVELRARFDEQSNLEWTRLLEQAGAHVIFGVRRFKTHAKICLVVRRSRDGIRRYVHLGTGNYNDRTARVYSDFGLLTSDRIIGEDASMFFNSLTGYSDPPAMRKLVMAPTQLRERFLALIHRETSRAQAGQAAEIRAKVNSLVDGGIIEALYAAAAAGVAIRLNVRGTCCLRAGVKKLSDGIQVVSIVDRFLEHSRVYEFRNGGNEEVYLSSADWMPRNLDRRIELFFPVEDPACRQRVRSALDACFQDNVKARRLRSDDTYRRAAPARGEEPFRAQLRLYEDAVRERDRLAGAPGAAFEPRTRP